jgi:hypothetical protein
MHKDQRVYIYFVNLYALWMSPTLNEYQHSSSLQPLSPLTGSQCKHYVGIHCVIDRRISVSATTTASVEVWSPNTPISVKEMQQANPVNEKQ